MWSEKHAPESIADFIGNEAAVKEASAWMDRWPHVEERALLFAGPPGVGKTTLARLLAKKMGLALVETNASDVRSAEALRATFSSSLGQRALFFKGRLLLFDEVDGLTAGDRGGVAELVKMVQKSAHPIILIANDPWEKKLRGLRNHCRQIGFKKVRPPEIFVVLERIAKAENVSVEKGALDALARLADGDIKAAINDLEYVAAGKSSVDAHDMRRLSYRDMTREIFETLKIIFKTTSARTAAEALVGTEKDLDEILQWIRENLPAEYKGTEELAAAYDAVSRADVFRGRIYHQQYWRFLAYTSDIMSIGVATSKKAGARTFVRYQSPSRIKQLARTKQTRASEKELAAALGKALHCSRKEARAYFPLLGFMEKKQPEVFERVMGQLGIEEASPG